MLELIAAAILQFFILSASPAVTPDNTQPAASTNATTASADADHGVGGWGDDH
ncbi:hypothetical protein [Hymenobacter rubripertinctus]|uniref:hypothetical protein n=1 Tax=Hymenobacter rubripertinctus TaxID=2029981 RepID=UPI0016017007|nr:hypothetical protein [Hymenobacter rubripertinctus]